MTKPDAQENVRLFLSEVSTFLTTTLKKEKLSKQATKERNNLLEGLCSLYSNNADLSQVESVDEGSTSSAKSADSSTTASAGSIDEYYFTRLQDKAIKDLKSPQKIGFLEWKNEFKKSATWQKCYCVIDGPIFYCYKHPRDSRQQWAMPVKDYWVDETPKKQRDGKKGKHFQLACLGRKPILFCSPNDADVSEWKSAVEAGKLHAKSNNNNNENFEEDFVDNFDIYMEIQEMPQKQTKNKTEKSTTTNVNADDMYYLVPQEAKTEDNTYCDAYTPSDQQEEQIYEEF